MWKSIRVRRIAVVMLLALGLVACLRSTSLPLDVSDLSAIQPQLDKLPEDERALVLGYLHRSTHVRRGYQAATRVSRAPGCAGHCGRGTTVGA
jgi:hypothetical protein